MLYLPTVHTWRTLPGLALLIAIVCHASSAIADVAYDPAVIAAAPNLPAGSALAGTPPPGATDPNLVPNSGYHGSTGVAATNNGVVTGTIPTLWRAFAVNGGAIDLEPLPLPADALYPGSPPTNAVKMTVAAFGADQGFDNLTALFQIVGERRHAGEVWLRTGNADQSSQQVSVSVPIFEGSPLVFSGRDPGAFTATATSTWALYQGPDFIEADDVLSVMAFRLTDDGSENSVIIALPTLEGAPVANDVPNPGFAGTGGTVIGAVAGTVPDQWRAFAVDDGELEIASVPLAPGGLYPGSPATTTVRLTMLNSASGPGFDHELNRIPLLPGFPYWVEVYLRSGNADQSVQAVSVGLPVFDDQGFTRRQPGSFGLTVGSEWSLYAGPAFFEAADTSTDIAFRPTADGGEDSIEIALPRIVGPSTDPLFRGDFETP